MTISYFVSTVTLLNYLTPRDQLHERHLTIRTAQLYSTAIPHVHSSKSFTHICHN